MGLSLCRGAPPESVYGNCEYLSPQRFLLGDALAAWPHLQRDKGESRVGFCVMSGLKSSISVVQLPAARSKTQASVRTFDLLVAGHMIKQGAAVYSATTNFAKAVSASSWFLQCVPRLDLAAASLGSGPVTDREMDIISRFSCIARRRHDG